MSVAAATLLRARLEATLAPRFPAALSPTPRIIREFVPTGIGSVDEAIGGGFPAGAITEVVGKECSGRTSLTLSFIASLTNAGKVCAWVDVSDALHPESAAAAGADLCRLLWVRCGTMPTTSRSIVSPKSSSAGAFSVPEEYFVPRPPKQGLHSGGFGPHPRDEVKGISGAIAGLLRKEKSGTQRAKTPQKTAPEKKTPAYGEMSKSAAHKKVRAPEKPWSRLNLALRVTDLLLENGGFGAIVLDMGDIAPEDALRVPLATWFRYRAVAAQKQTSIVVLLQHPCAKSSAALTLRLQSIQPRSECTVFIGVEFSMEVERLRLAPTPESIAPLRKPPHRVTCWRGQTAWAGR